MKPQLSMGVPGQPSLNSLVVRIYQHQTFAENQRSEVEEFFQRDIKCLRDGIDVVERYITLAALNSSDVGSMESALVGEPLL